MNRSTRTAAASACLSLAIAACTPSNPAPSDSSPAETTPVPSASSTESASPDPSPTTSEQSTATPNPPGRKASNVPMEKLKPGEKAPQFIIVSFDGAGSHAKWQEFMAVAKKTDARFVGFVTGTYFIDDQHKTAYQGPGHKAGKSSVGFGGDAQRIATLVNDLNEAYAAGHEIGTHYNGHFCAGAGPSGNDWSTADWKNEIGQFKKFLTEHKAINGYDDSFPELKVPVEHIKGGRTPCLEGKLEAMIPAWKDAGFTYDTSMVLSNGLSWPEKIDGIWEFQMPVVNSPAFDKPGYKSPTVMAMDYNFWIKFNGGKDDKSKTAEMTRAARQTYDYMYEQAFGGNRAPLVIGNHFNNWSGNAFNPAVASFMADTCGKEATYCTTYQDVIAWMELQDPEVLKALLDQPAHP